MVKKRVDRNGRKLPDGFSQRPDGRYMARFTFQGKRYAVYDMKLSELKRKVNKKKYELENGAEEKIYGNLTVDQWYKMWMELYRSKGEYKFATLQTQMASYDYYVKEHLGDMRLADVRQIHVLELFHCLSERGLSYNTICKADSVISAMFRDAVANELVEKNPAAGAMRSIKKTGNKAKKALSEEQQERFLRFIKNDDYYQGYYSLYVVAFHTGMRVGELCGLTWDNVDFERDMICVDKTLMSREDRMNGGGQKIVLNSPKTKKSKRNIPMLPVVRTALEQQREWMRHVEVSEIDGVSDFVFCSRQGGTVLKPRTIYAMLRRIVKKINEREAEDAARERREPDLLDNFSPHEIRHTFTTRCFEKGMNPKVIAEILGHSGMQMTLGIYTHISEDMKALEMRLLDESPAESCEK